MKEKFNVAFSGYQVVIHKVNRSYEAVVTDPNGNSIAQFGYNMAEILNSMKGPGEARWAVKYKRQGHERVTTHAGHIPTMTAESGKGKAETITEIMRQEYGKAGICWWYIGRMNQETFVI